MPAPPLILVTNDDGVYAEGLSALADAMTPLGEVAVVAPATEQSAVSHSLTLRSPLRVNRVAEGRFAVEGTPTDCVLLAIHNLLGRTPDLIISGINHGTNLGDDVTYSGTVSAAMEGTLNNILSVAVSLEMGPHCTFTEAGALIRPVVQRVLAEGLPKDTLLNINIPNCRPADQAGYAWTTQGRRTYGDVIVQKADPRGRPYYWIGSGKPIWTHTHGTDVEAVREGKVSITPVHLNLTNFEAIEDLRSWEFPAPEAGA